MAYLILSLARLCSRCSNSSQTGLLVLLSLGTILVQKLEQLSSCVLVKGVAELRDGRRDLQALLQDNLLALQTDVLGPFDEASKITPGLDVIT